MIEKPHPTALGAGPVRPVEEHRTVYCPHYGDCLNVAVKQGWRDWTCRRCSMFGCHTPSTAARFAEVRLAREY